VVGRPLTERDLDRRQRERELALLPLAARLRRTGALFDPPRALTVTPWVRLRRVLRAWLINRRRPVLRHNP
jgi:hypothetical protein